MKQLAFFKVAEASIEDVEGPRSYICTYVPL